MKFTFWKNNPAFKILIPMVLGVVFAILLKWENQIFLWIGIVGILLYALLLLDKSYIRRGLKGVLLSISVCCLAVQLVVVKTEIYQPSHFSFLLSPTDKLIVSLNEQLSPKANSYKGVLKVSGIVHNQKVIPAKGLILAYFAKDSTLAKLQYGDEFIINVSPKSIPKPANPEQFNYKYYLTLNNINHQVYLKAQNVVPLYYNVGNRLISASYRMRDYCYRTLQQNGVVGDQLKVASALLLGYREKLDADLVKSYSSAGAMHVLAVSGLHVGILFFILKFSFSFLKRFPKGKWVFTLVILTSLWFYAMMTGFSPSVLRATTMFSFVLVGEQVINRKTSIYNTLAVSAIVLLVVNPYLIFEVGFQLSYLAVVGIVYLQPKIYQLFYVPNMILDNAWKITAVSISAQIATFPLGLYYFHQFPVYFFVSNLIVIPTATLIIYIGVLLFVTSPIGGISLVFGKLLNGIIWVLNWSVKATESLAYSLIQEISITRLETYLMYLLFVVFLFGLYYRKLKYLYASGVLVVVFLCFQIVERYKNINRKEFTVYTVKNKTAFEFTKGKQIYFFGDSALYQDDNAMLFNVKHNWFKKNITQKQFVPSSFVGELDGLFVANGVIQFYNKRLLVLAEQNISLVEKLPFDYVLVSKQKKRYLHTIKKHQQHIGVIILDSTISSFELDYWKKQFPKSEVISTRKKYFSVKI